MNLPDVLYLYRQHGASVCASMAPQWYAHRDQILDLARERREQGSDRLQRGEVVEIAAAHRSPSARAVAKTYAFWAHCALQNGDRRRAIRYARSAVSADPSAWRHWANLFRMPFAKLPALDEVNASEEQAPHESSSPTTQPSTYPSSLSATTRRRCSSRASIVLLQLLRRCTRKSSSSTTPLETDRPNFFGSGMATSKSSKTPRISGSGVPTTRCWGRRSGAMSCC